MIRFPEDVSNIVERVYKTAQFYPDETALILTEGEKVSYREVFQRTQALREQIKKKNLKKGDRVLILFPFDEKFVFLIMALFADNIVPVILDPRVPKKCWQALLKESRIQGIFLTQKMRRWRFLAWWMNSFKLWDVEELFQVAENNSLNGDFALLATKPEDEVLVTLTSGTTGQPKIVSRKFAIIERQQFLSCKYLPPVSHDIHLALYGIGVLQSLAEGACTVLLPTKRQQVRHIIESLQQNKVTRLSGPPGLLTDFLLKAEADSLKFDSLENIITGGAPLPKWWQQKAKELFPQAELTILYGSTECEPISFSSSNKNPNQIGYAVGLPVSEVQLSKKKFKQINNQEVFEVLLKGPNCVANSPDGFYTGDLAIEFEQSLWLLGRKTETLNGFPVAFIEEPLERLEGVKRVAALYKEEFLKIYFEPMPGFTGQKKLLPIFTEKAQALAKEYNFTKVQIKQLKKIPVDPRHGWKIQRSQL